MHGKQHTSPIACSSPKSQHTEIRVTAITLSNSIWKAGKINQNLSRWLWCIGRQCRKYRRFLSMQISCCYDLWIRFLNPTGNMCISNCRVLRQAILLLQSLWIFSRNKFWNHSWFTFFSVKKCFWLVGLQPEARKFHTGAWTKPIYWCSAVVMKGLGSLGC